MRHEQTRSGALLIAPFLLIVILLGRPSGRSAAEELVPPSMDAQMAAIPESIKPAARILLEEGSRNAVLNWLQLGRDAIHEGDYEIARLAFDQAIAGISNTFSNTEAAQRARSVWHEEKDKDFKGEPYERAMAYYYRGLLYILLEGEYDNARAMFRSGELQDAFAEEEQHRCDFSLLYFLDGWCSYMLGDDAQAEQAFGCAQALRPGLERPAPGDNTLVLIETGTAPRKIADGVGHSELVYRRGRNFAESKVAVAIDTLASAACVRAEDVYWQASTRGGRIVDRILEGKLVFRRTAEGVSNALADLGSGLTGQSLLDGGGNAVGLALSGIGATVALVAASARPHADIRSWKNLPDAVHVRTCRLVTGPHEIDVRFADGKGADLPDLAVTLSHIRDESPQSSLLLVSSRRQLYSSELVPNDRPWVRSTVR